MGAQTDNTADSATRTEEGATLRNHAPRVNAAACLEAAGAWFSVLSIGFVLLLVMLVALQRAEVRDLRAARLEVRLQEVRDRLEADLALGFELSGSGRAQDLLEDTLARDASLLAAEVFDVTGVSLFNTDRGSIGERVPAAWLSAIERMQAVPGGAEGHVPWSADGADPALGLPVRGPFGEVVGHVGMALRPLPAPAPGTIVVHGVGVLLAFGVLAWVLVVRTLRARLRAGDGGSMARIEARLLATQERLGAILSRLAGDGGRSS